MSKPKNHIPKLGEHLAEYTDSRLLDLHQYSPYHARIMDGGYVVLDVWTTGRYYIVMTDYAEMTDGNVIERGGEKGWLPLEGPVNTKPIWSFLDQIFFPENGFEEKK